MNRKWFLKVGPIEVLSKGAFSHFFFFFAN